MLYGRVEVDRYLRLTTAITNVVRRYYYSVIVCLCVHIQIDAYTHIPRNCELWERFQAYFELLLFVHRTACLQVLFYSTNGTNVKSFRVEGSKGLCSSSISFFFMDGLGGNIKLVTGYSKWGEQCTSHYLHQTTVQQDLGNFFIMIFIMTFPSNLQPWRSQLVLDFKKYFLS